ncbi:MAG: glycoside hydrolase family 127 protein [Clostridia bacterium]|nr:glycoside hydrolase family 127 protein [Clostridia bacterium]
MEKAFPLESNRPLRGGARVCDAFWSPKLATFFRVTLKDTFDKLEKDGALENYENVAAGRLHTHRGAPWHDGLLLETIRGAADYIRRGERDETLTDRIDRYAEAVEAAQLAAGGGYLSTYTLLERPDQRYGENGGSILWQHDLYNNGALFEAGVHYYRATGHVRLLECALRSANELAALIGPPPRKWIVPGHELPSYALIELIQLMEEESGLAARLSVPVRTEAYRALAHFWIHGRGHHEHRINHPQYMGEYSQDHAPIEGQFQAVGHAVRATLYYTGVTRLAMLEGDESLLRASVRLWDNVTERKLHVNGGVGATHFEEKFGEDYDLPNTAYLETCASAGLILWADSLSRATSDARYYGVIKRALYNLMLSSVTLQGDHYFYRNPLTSKGDDHHWAWHSCPCCPPMIHKTFGMFDRLIAAQDDQGVLLNLFVGGDLQAQGAWGDASLHVDSALPWQGRCAVRVDGAKTPFLLRLRVPDWAERIRFTRNGQAVEPAVERGYAQFSVAAGDEIAFEDSMPARRIEAHPYVRSDRGRVAIARGPLVYCVEGVDNRGCVDFTLAEDPGFELEERPELLGGVVTIRARTETGERLTAIPLYAWDNRLAGGMNVWLRQQGKPDTWDVTGWKKKLYRTFSETGAMKS